MTAETPAGARRRGRLRRTRVAVIGAGYQANYVHYPALASLPEVEIAAICDLDESRLNSTADKYQVEGRFTDYRNMIEQVAPDAVCAIGQPQIMYDIWVWCLQQRQHLFIEKPLGLTLHQARALTHLAEQNSCITQVGLQRRSCPMLVMLREQCLKRGPIVHAVCEFYKCAIEPYLEARDHMTDDGIHAIDTLRWICGGEVAKIESVIKSVLVPDINFIAALLHFDNGSTALLVNSWSSGRRIFRVEMHAPGICAEGNPEGSGFIYADADVNGVGYDTRQVAGSDELFVFGGFQAKHREFIDAVRAGRQPGSHFADALKTMEVAERILAQNLLG